jgi:formylglycine-generating enzyme required for sulfatase activity
MPSKVFISYRRDDAKWQAREIYGSLKRVLPPDHLFMDTEDIPPGIDFVEYLEGWVDQCDIMLALIGPGWADAVDPETGRRRLENPNDFVRIEVRRGLARGIPVVPILLDGARPPGTAQLPDDLVLLARRSAEFIDHRTVDSDVERLIRKLKLTEQPGQSAPTNPVAASSPVASVDAKVVQGAEGQITLGPSRQVRWIGAIAAVLIAAYCGAHYIGIPVWWPGSAASVAEAEKLDAQATLRVYQRDPALSVTPGSGQSFIDRLADGQPCPQCPEMVVAPAGNFEMGSPTDEPGRQEGETQIPVEIARPFAVGKFAVTFDQWDACVADGGCNGYKPSDRRSGRGNRPVINVNWSDANAFAQWLSRKTGKTYRLLSEAEHEYVTRASTTTPFWWGRSITPKQANYNGNYTYNGGTKGEYRAQTVPVDSFEANPWGLFNVHGNVWEWTADCWNDSNIGNPGNGSARTTGVCTRRVVRGGSCYIDPQNVRAASRGGSSTVIRVNDLGFRLARTLNP